MELQPKTEPGFGTNDHTNMENMSILDLVSVCRTAYLTEQFDSVEHVLVSRSNRMQTEIQHLQDKFEMERLTRLQAEEDLKKREIKCERCKRAKSNYEKLLKEVKKTSLGFRETIDELEKKNNELELEVSELRKLEEKWVIDSNAVDELRIRVGVLENKKNSLGVKNSELEKKNNDLELEVCELRKLKEKWVIDSKALAEVRIRVDVLENEKNALAALEVRNSELEKSMKKISKNLADVGITVFQEKEIAEPPMMRAFDEQETGNDTVEPDEDEPPSKRNKDARGASSVDEGAEDTEEVESSDDEESDELSGESSYEDEITKQSQRNGKRKVSMDFDTTQPKFSGSNKVAMVKKARKCPSGTVNENPFFEITMSHCYANGYILWLPTKFSREHLINYKGTATLRVGKEMAMEVSLGFHYCGKNACMSGGWKMFREKYNLQVDDLCKFEMIQRRPASFTVTITRGRNGPSPKKLLGVSCGNNLVKKKDIGETSSRSRPKENFLEEGCDVMKHNTLMVLVKNKDPLLPKEFMKRGCHENILELKMRGHSWFVKVKYYEYLGCRFSEGWRQFMKECKVEIGDTCLFKLIDERKFVFDVSILGRIH